jgi:DNA-binding NarL/FixJ family response regulator
MIRILIAEDHEVVRSGIKSLLEKEDDMKVIGEAGNGLEALRLLESGLQPNILLSDISMPEVDGIRLATEMQDRFPEVKIIILSMMNHENYVFEAFDAGVSGYLLKNTGSEELFFCIRQVHAGNQFICNEIAVKMLHKAMNSRMEAELPVSLELTAREIEILTLTAQGFTNQEIAEKLFTSRRTVEGHRQHLLEKTGARNTAALIQLAFKTGMLK